MITKTWVAIATMLLFLADVSAAQRWSIDQLEVWCFITEGWELKQSTEGESGERELLWLEQNLHPDYQSVSSRIPMPIGKAKLLEGLRYDRLYTKTQFYLLEPQRILLHGNTAVVHYTFSWVYTTRAGKEVDAESGHRKSLVTAVLVREGDRWLQLADHINDIP